MDEWACGFSALRPDASGFNCCFALGEASRRPFRILMNRALLLGRVMEKTSESRKGRLWSAREEVGSYKYD